MARSAMQTVSTPSEGTPKGKKTFAKKIFSKSTYRPVTNLFKEGGSLSRTPSRATSRTDDSPTSSQPAYDLEPVLKAKASEAATVAVVEVTTPEKADVKPPADTVVPVEIVDTTAQDEAPAVQVASAEDVEVEVEVEVEVKETVDAAEETLVSSHDTVEPSASVESAPHTPAEEPIRLAQPGETSDHQLIERSVPDFDLGNFIRNTVVPLLTCGVVPPESGSRPGDDDN